MQRLPIRPTLRPNTSKQILDSVQQIQPQATDSITFGSFRLNAYPQLQYIPLPHISLSREQQCHLDLDLHKTDFQTRTKKVSFDCYF